MFVSFTYWSLLSSLSGPSICRPLLLMPWPWLPPLTPGSPLSPRIGRTTHRAGIATETAGCGLMQGAGRPGSGCGAQANAPAQDALRPGPVSAKGESRIGSWRKTQFAQGVVQENANPEDCNEGESREGNAARPVAIPSATAPVGTPLQRQASGLPPLPTDCRSVSNLRRGC